MSDMPLHSPDAEKTVAGGLMLTPETIFELAPKIAVDDFHATGPRMICQAALALRDKDELINPITVAGYLESVELWGGYHGVASLNELMELCEARSLSSAVVTVLQHGEQRRFQKQLMRVTNDAAQPNADMNAIRSSLWELSKPATSNRGIGISPVSTMLQRHPTLKEPVIHGLVRRGEVMNCIANTKVGKSWLAMGTAIAVSEGEDFLGFPTTKGRVLGVDNELYPETTAYRYNAVAEAHGKRSDRLNGIDELSLRGRLIDLNGLERILRKQADNDYSLIILDAFYKFLPQGVSENDNAQIAAVYNLLDSMARELDAAIMLIHHSTKGDQAGKRTTDVGAGAGSQSRAADTHLVLREHEQGEQYAVLHAAVRSFAPLEPVTLRWEFPRWFRDEQVAPKLKRPVSRGEVTQSRNDQEGCERILKAFDRTGEETLTVGAIRTQAGMGHTRAMKLINQLLDSEQLQEDRREKMKNGNTAIFYRPTKSTEVQEPDCNELFA